MPCLHFQAHVLRKGATLTHACQSSKTTAVKPRFYNRPDFRHALIGAPVTLEFPVKSSTLLLLA
jgi:hypothetical protein